MTTDSNAITHLDIHTESVGIYRCDDPSCYVEEIVGTDAETDIGVRVTQAEAIAGIVGTCPGCCGELATT